jgi:hypothetical protein
MNFKLKNIKFISPYWLVVHSLSFIICLFIFGCQKVINVNLNSVSPAIVIIGNVNDQPGPYLVTVSQTVNFSDDNTFPPVSGAFITIADNAGTTDTLVESPPGTYNTRKLVGVAGRTYSLKVVYNGQTYISTSTMPQAVTFDTLLPFQQIGFRDTNLYVQAGFQDPTSQTNYYRFIESINYSIQSKILVLDDEFSNGRYIHYTLRSDSSLKPGFNIIVEMECIDQGTYQYFSTFREATGSTNLTPANPISNITNNALGYFSAHTSQYKTLVVP